MKIADIQARYPRYDPPRWNWRKYLGPVPVWVQTDEGLTGVGLSCGGLAALPIINGHLHEELVGRDPLEIEERWNEVRRATRPYGPNGIAMMAVSGIDHALWDIRGQAEGEPVHRLIAPEAEARQIPVYVTGQVAALRPRSDGITKFKTARHAWPDEPGALERNVAEIRRAREQIGEGADLMIDAWCKWDVDHAVRVMEAVADCRPLWLEDPLPYEDEAGYAELKRRLPQMPIALGNFATGPLGLRKIVADGVADIIQPDASWVGGITPTLQICDVAAAAGKRVVLHRGGEPWGLHVTAAKGLDLAEFVLTDDADLWIDPPLVGPPRPMNGMIKPSDEPGLGISFDPTIAYEKVGFRRQ